MYRDEVAGLIERFNSVSEAGRAQALRAEYQVQSQHRTLGWTEIPCPNRRSRSTTSDYEQHVKDYMPTAEDKKLLLDIIANEKKWIAPKEGARDPLASIGEVRKSAINL